MKGLYTEVEANKGGWDHDVIEIYPTHTQVAEASRPQLIEWHKFLREPENPMEVIILNLIMARLKESCPK